MSNSENETLLASAVSTKNLPPSQELSEDDTSTTTISDEEIFEDCETDSTPLVELGKRTEGDRPEGSSGAENLRRIDSCYEALQYYPGKSLGSSEDSKKTSSTENSVDLGCITEYRTDEAGNFDYVEVDYDISIDDKDMVKLMKKMSLNHYTAVSCEGDFTLSKCKGLFQRDYQCEVIDNSGGSLCRHYPPRIIVPIAKKSSTASCPNSGSMEFNTKRYTEQVKKSVSSRLRTRFVVPVVLFDNKFICRSGTLSVRKSAVYETARKMETPKALNIAASAIQRAARYLANSILDASSRGCKATSQLFIPNSMEKLRDVDAQIIRDLKIQYICDLMIEDRKKFKQVIRVSSSEKINKDIYCDCSIEQMPYPGCKMFKSYHDASHRPEGLVFDWNRPDVNCEMMFSEDPYVCFPTINWSNYKEWDLVELTKNYLKMMLYYIAKGRGGLLVHCISGWDRTPLFITILRASLWADGVIHESLTYREMAYLTLAYDWYLFGHDLPDRLRKNQEIMHFCFKFLPYIITDEFSITRIFHQLPPDVKGNRTFPEFVPERRDVLHFLSVYVLGYYFQEITERAE